ncbi:hypothetical protein BD289DRAFT_223801 [Coniella lustricola]|uniref:Uncharacterized protein n=1 Tax=Coniella lustricola TaxID=2025994 RepID=A0A2T3AAY4_9PEZI|nr:hypothetical protein BD289DRAFT_223801 [Coniella lustricola]
MYVISGFVFLIGLLLFVMLFDTTHLCVLVLFSFLYHSGSLCRPCHTPVILLYFYVQIVLSAHNVSPSRATQP